ncbi:sensor histidine kinase [Chryseotalea sanaruensis]|uniref:histidine kinase n=1 Tax=Chryseotalea sanaruensis TaxID=2482724 RepID=A0A401U5D3_9BACT|nr:HAMP domain-containing sensor histidine kinase [Chryseotalea sanaruensis]GCC50121.1 sensor histidine kinase [Chryseotalea sanaruensis]
MKSKYLRSIIIWGTFLLICLFSVQLYWFNRAFDVAEKQFDHTVQVALKKVADSVAKDTEIKKLSSNFFLATTESELNSEEIDKLVKNEFELRSLTLDYELGIYNADDDTLVYGNYVAATRQKLYNDKNESVEAGGAKNLAIYFPGKRSYLAAEMKIWIFSTAILLLMFTFFAYAIVSLLRERKFSELKNDFINNMTHEFRTPVTNIGIAAEILKKKAHVDNQLYIDILMKENEKLRQKIDQVLLGASVDQLKRPSLAQLNLHQLIIDCAEAFHFKLQQRNGDIQLEFKAANPEIIGDRELLTQAIANLIDNAEKYSPQNPSIIVRTQDTGKGVEIQVIDKGIGIESSMTKKVFDKFFRISTGDVHNVKGFGLGLNFVKQVIDSHKGHVNLWSELNQGTEVRILLPK